MDDEPREPCTLVKNFIARQGIILIAGIIFLTWTAIRVKLRYERRNLKTFAADCSKQAGQQMMGGVMMVGLGVMLAKESGFDSLAWCSPSQPAARNAPHSLRPPAALRPTHRYGAQYPFEIVMTTVFTGVFKRWVEIAAVRLGRRTRWKWLVPFKFFGQYGPKPHEFRCRWYLAQLVQAVFLIGLPARLCALCIIWVSLSLPDSASPVHALASAWYRSGLSCETQTAFILYAIPLTGDAVQFVIIDRLQAFGFLARPAGVSREFEDLDEAAEASTECDSCLRHRDREIGMEPA